MTAVSALSPQPASACSTCGAAPGGKSTQIAALMQGPRAARLQRAGALARADPLAQRRAHGRAERRGRQRDARPACRALPRVLRPNPRGRAVLGRGMFRRQEEARAEWNEHSPRGCAERQLEILAEAAKMLAPGGALVYSTCTFNDTENEGVLERFLGAHPEFALEPFALCGLPPAEKGYLHLYPHEMRGEGHFVSLLRKARTPHPPNLPRRKKAVGRAPRRRLPCRMCSRRACRLNSCMPRVAACGACRRG